MWILVAWGFLNGMPLADTFMFTSKEACESARDRALKHLEAEPKLSNVGAFCVDTRTKYI